MGLGASASWRQGCGDRAQPVLEGESREAPSQVPPTAPAGVAERTITRCLSRTHGLGGLGETTALPERGDVQ